MGALLILAENPKYRDGINSLVFSNTTKNRKRVKTRYLIYTCPIDLVSIMLRCTRHRVCCVAPTALNVSTDNGKIVQPN